MDMKFIFKSSLSFPQLMSKMAPLLGKDMTERLFLLRFCEMCTDPLFHVRKVIKPLLLSKFVIFEML